MRPTQALRSTGMLATLVLLACGGQPEEVASHAVNTYDVRGVIRQIKPAANGKTQLSIHHEAIPDFVGIQGEVEGMKPMTMPFAVDDSIDLEGLEVGQGIAFELTVDWSAADPGLITRIERLPDDTEFEFGRSN